MTNPDPGSCLAGRDRCGSRICERFAVRSAIRRYFCADRRPAPSWAASCRSERTRETRIVENRFWPPKAASRIECGTASRESSVEGSRDSRPRWATVVRVTRRRRDERFTPGRKMRRPARPGALRWTVAGRSPPAGSDVPRSGWCRADRREACAHGQNERRREWRRE